MKQKLFNQNFVSLMRNPIHLDENNLFSSIKNGAKLSARRAFEVYAGDYQARFTDTLKNTYRSIYSIIGHEDFLRLSLDYIKDYPSTFSDLDDYGNHFSHFITTHFLIEDYIFLSELAHFEWSIREIFHMDQELGLDSNMLSELLSGNIAIVQMAKSIKLLTSSHQITSLYALHESVNEHDDIFDFIKPQYLILIKKSPIIITHELSINQWGLFDLFTNSLN